MHSANCARRRGSPSPCCSRSALGIGANSAIFTLVNAILLHNLPVTDPKTLIRIGDKDDCCVNGGWNDNGDYSLFATDTYYMFKKNLPEFEELAAMESGYAWRPITVRRAGPQTRSEVRRWEPSSPATTSASSVFRRRRAGSLWMPTTRRAHPLPL